jgi:hypothetical protein
MSEENTSSQLNDLDQIKSSLSWQDNVENITIVRREGFKAYMFPLTFVFPYGWASTYDNYNTSLFLADRDYEIVEATERHDVANTANTAKLFLYSVPADDIVPSGTNVLTDGWKIGTDSTALTPITLQADPAQRLLPKGRYLGLHPDDGTLTGLNGVIVSVILKAL